MKCHDTERSTSHDGSLEDGATRPGRGDPAHEFLGSVSVFASVVSTIVDETLAGVSGENALTLGQLRFLELVAYGDEANLSEIARSVGISNAAVSRTLDKLVDLGLVTRRPGSADRRTIRLGLTEAGDAVLADYRARIESALVGTLAESGSETLVPITAAVDRMTRALLGARVGEPPPCRGCIACNLFRRADCPLGADRPHAACHSGPGGQYEPTTAA